MADDQFKPLANVRVLDATDWVSGPMAGLTLAAFGADVVKIERPGKGDPFRSFGLRHKGLSAFWTNINHGKRSVALDLRHEDGVAAMRGLAAVADVFIQNWRPGKAAELGLGDEVLAAANPRLIRVGISGFGPDGPRAAAPAYDGVLQALSGVVAAQGRGRRPDSIGMYLMDKLAAVYVVQSVLAALLSRRDTGEGCRIDVAMLDVAAHFNFPDIFQEQTFLDSEQRLAPARSPVIATGDGHLILVPVSGRQIAATCGAFDRPEWLDELKQITDPNTLIGTLYERIEAAVATMSNADVLARLAAADIAAAAVLDQDAHLRDPQVLHNDAYFVSSDMPQGAVRRVAYPSLFNGSRMPPPRSAPLAGEHTDQVIEEWGA